MTRDPGRGDEDGLDTATLQGLAQDVGAEQLAIVIGLFADELARRAADLDRAREAVDVDGLRRAAHGIKGSASTFGARRVEAAARRLETDCRSARSPQELAVACGELLAAMERSAGWVRRWLAAPGKTE